ncbi:MAG: META domain-containing protein, partial [bacterium]|nr:META domain-containing protein [bacterium]
KIKFILGPSTMIACFGPVMEQEANFIRVLKEADRYQIAGRTLTLFKGEKELARFRGSKNI